MKLRMTFWGDFMTDGERFFGVVIDCHKIVDNIYFLGRNSDKNNIYIISYFCKDNKSHIYQCAGARCVYVMFNMIIPQSPLFLPGAFIFRGDPPPPV